MTSARPTPEFPPDTFNVLAKPFRPGAESIGTPALQDSVEQLVREKKLRSAMDQILAALDKDPENQQALRLAMIIFGAIGKTQQVNADEALTPRHWNDCRLDSVFAVCSLCRRSSWVPDECLFGFAEIAVQNPIGLQCHECGYVVCRKCLQQVLSQFAGANLSCPNCGHCGNGKPVYPTGRLTLQLKRFGAPVRILLLLREGPVPPSAEYARKLLDKLNPDPLSPDAQFIVQPVESWTDSVGSIGYSMLNDLMSRNGLAMGLHETDGEIVTDDEGLKVAIFRAVDLPPFDSLVSALKTKLADQPRSAARFIQQLMLEHLERVSEQNRSQPAYERSTVLWSRLISPAVLEDTTQAMMELLPQANQTGQHAFKALQRDTLLLVVSAIPATDSAIVRTHFHGGYFGFLEENGFMARAPENNFVHWILCADDTTVAIHLSTLPMDHGAIPLYDVDILSQAERAAMGV